MARSFRYRSITRKPSYPLETMFFNGGSADLALLENDFVLELILHSADSSKYQRNYRTSDMSKLEPPTPSIMSTPFKPSLTSHKIDFIEPFLEKTSFFLEVSNEKRNQLENSIFLEVSNEKRKQLRERAQNAQENTKYEIISISPSPDLKSVLKKRSSGENTYTERMCRKVTFAQPLIADSNNPKVDTWPRTKSTSMIFDV